MTLVSLWNQFANLTYPIVGLFLLTMTGQETAILATAAFVGVAILGVAVAGLVAVLYSSRMAEDIGDVAARGATWARARLKRNPVRWDGRSFERFRLEVVGVLRRRWHVLTLATLVGSLSVFAVLLVSLRALHVPAADVSAVEAFAAWSLARLLGSIPITPGGIGVVELSLSAALVALRWRECERGRRRARVPVPDRRADARPRPARGGGVAPPVEERSGTVRLEGCRLRSARRSCWIRAWARASGSD